jgi:pilus assembly protein FimV
MGKMTSNAAHITKLKALSTGVLLAWSIPSHALTLGKFQVQSAMGEPLRAEVEITQFTPDELRGLQAQIAAPNSFKQAGMEYNPALNGLVARVENRSDGRPVIVLDGRSPVQDSFIDLILEAKSSTGRVVKNYALLLNAASTGTSSRTASSAVRTPAPSEVIASPVTLAKAANATSTKTSPNVELNGNGIPVYRFDTPDTSSASAPAPAAPSSRATQSDVQVNSDRVPVYRFDTPDTASAQPTTNTRPTPNVVAPAVIASPSNEAFASDDDTVTVNPGDTASSLVMARLPDGITLEQMMLAVVRANPHAFIEGNVNLVRSGTVLRLPKASEAAQISRAQARETVLAQNRDFASYARRVAGSPLLVGSAESREMSGKVSKTEPQAPESVAKQDKLTLSKAQLGNNSEEAKIAAERESKDAAEQLNALKKNMDDLQALAKGPQAEASTTMPTTANSDTTLLDQMGQNKSVWAWALGALLALLALVFWSRRNSNKAEEVFAPSYDDDVSPKPPVAGTTTNIPQQITDIDLNLDRSPAPEVQAPAQAADHVTDENKLALASQLLSSGDKDLARTLITSVASTASGDLKARALQMLGQIA